MSFSPAEITALRTIAQALADVDVVLIGAAALREFGFCRWRTTFDLDLTVALDEDDSPGPLGNVPELRCDERLGHRWYADNVKLDIVPAGPALRAQGHIQCGDRKMTLAGLHLAFDHGVSRPIGSDLVVRVAPPPVVALLQMISYCERPVERERDLGDLAELLDKYIGDDDDRRFDERVTKSEIAWEEVSAHELGVDLARVITDAEWPMLQQFLQRVRGGDAMGTLARLLRVAAFSREESEHGVLRQVDALMRGLGAGGNKAEP